MGKLLWVVAVGGCCGLPLQSSFQDDPPSPKAMSGPPSLCSGGQASKVAVDGRCGRALFDPVNPIIREILIQTKEWLMGTPPTAGK